MDTVENGGSKSGSKIGEAAVGNSERVEVEGDSEQALTSIDGEVISEHTIESDGEIDGEAIESGCEGTDVYFQDPETGCIYNPFTGEVYDDCASNATEDDKDDNDESELEDGEVREPYCSPDTADGSQFNTNNTTSADADNGYEWDEVAGCYVHKTTGFFYDPISCTLYNPKSGLSYDQTTGVCEHLPSGRRYVYNTERGCYIDEVSEKPYNLVEDKFVLCETEAAADAEYSGWREHFEFEAPPPQPQQSTEEDKDDEEREDELPNTNKTPRVCCARPASAKTYLVVKTLEVEEDGLCIGRSQANGLRLAEIGVSKFHAQIVYEDSKFVIKDCQSQNGTYVNGHSVNCTRFREPAASATITSSVAETTTSTSSPTATVTSASTSTSTSTSTSASTATATKSATATTRIAASTKRATPAVTSTVAKANTPPATTTSEAATHNTDPTATANPTAKTHTKTAAATTTPKKATSKTHTKTAVATTTPAAATATSTQGTSFSTATSSICSTVTKGKASEPFGVVLSLGDKIRIASFALTVSAIYIQCLPRERNSRGSKITLVVAKGDSDASRALSERDERELRLKNLKRAVCATPSEISDEYRDRARERRHWHPRLFFKRDPAHKQSMLEEDDVPTVVSEVNPLPTSNLGHTMLKKMGWSEGKGLGSSEHGIVAPVMVQKRAGREGLGRDPTLTSAATKGAKMPFSERTRQAFRQQFS